MAVALYLLWDEALFQYVSILSLVMVAVSLLAIAVVRRLAQAGNPAGVS
jgi:ABC-type Fe3+ transport system permease subunit